MAVVGCLCALTGCPAPPPGAAPLEVGPGGPAAPAGLPWIRVLLLRRRATPPMGDALLHGAAGNGGEDYTGQPGGVTGLHGAAGDGGQVEENPSFSLKP